MSKQKYELGNVIETKDGLHLVMAIMVFPQSFEYIVMVDGKYENIKEKDVIAAYKEIPGGDKKTVVKRTRKAKKKVEVAPAPETKKSPLDSAMDTVDDELANIK